MPDTVTVFFNVIGAPPRLIVLGALDYAASLASIGRFLGYWVTVCDARPVFATAERFPDAHDVVVAWPHQYLAATSIDERTAICVLTHDPKFDVPALEIALRSPALYVGAMGSRRTCEDREQRLRAGGRHRGRTRPARRADRIGPRRLDTGRDRGVDRRGAGRPAAAGEWRAVAADQREDSSMSSGSNDRKGLARPHRGPRSDEMRTGSVRSQRSEIMVR